MRDLNRMIELHPLWRSRDIQPDDTLCFVLMPLDESGKIESNGKLYDVAQPQESVVKPVVEEHGLRYITADDIWEPGVIMQQVLGSIAAARVIVAELTGENPNVFYEVGMAHQLGKQVILLAQEKPNVPFDFQSLRFIFYEWPRDIEVLRERLAAMLDNILK